MTIVRLLTRVADLQDEVAAAPDRCTALANLYEHGMRIYSRLHALGDGFDSYNEENRATFLPSLLEWLSQVRSLDMFGR